MSTRKRRVFSPEFKREAVALLFRSSFTLLSSLKNAGDAILTVGVFLVV